MAAFDALRTYFTVELEQRRAQPSDDLITELAHAEIDGDRLSDDEIFATLRLLLPAGIETTYRSIGNLLFALLTHPDQLADVKADRSLVPDAVEEALRWEGPIVFTGRQSTRPSTLGGLDVPAGASVTVFLASANRDEARFEDPDRFDVRRQQGAHLAFGSGPHACLGMHLARMEMRLALTALLDRLPDLRLDPVAAAPQLTGLPLRSPTALRVLFGPASVSLSVGPPRHPPPTGAPPRRRSARARADPGRPGRPLSPGRGRVSRGRGWR
jgi:cytochrome P450